MHNRVRHRLPDHNHRESRKFVPAQPEDHNLGAKLLHYLLDGMDDLVMDWPFHLNPLVWVNRVRI